MDNYELMHAFTNETMSINLKMHFIFIFSYHLKFFNDIFVHYPQHL